MYALTLALLMGGTPDDDARAAVAVQLALMDLQRKAVAPAAYPFDPSNETRNRPGAASVPTGRGSNESRSAAISDSSGTIKGTNAQGAAGRFGKSRSATSTRGTATTVSGAGLLGNMVPAVTNCPT